MQQAAVQPPVSNEKLPNFWDTVLSQMDIKNNSINFGHSINNYQPFVDKAPAKKKIVFSNNFGKRKVKYQLCFV